jgi:hypothetical protein
MTAIITFINDDYYNNTIVTTKALLITYFVDNYCHC